MIYNYRKWFGNWARFPNLMFYKSWKVGQRRSFKKLRSSKWKAVTRSGLDNGDG